MTRRTKFLKYMERVSDFRDLTPHPIVVHTEDGSRTTYIPEGEPLRVPESDECLGSIANQRIALKGFDAKEMELPPIEDGVMNIVSLKVAQVVAMHFPDRVDFVIPNEIIRDENGQDSGCRSFAFID